MHQDYLHSADGNCSTNATLNAGRVFSANGIRETKAHAGQNRLCKATFLRDSSDYRSREGMSRVVLHSQVFCTAWRWVQSKGITTADQRLSRDYVAFNETAAKTRPEEWCGNGLFWTSSTVPGIIKQSFGEKKKTNTIAKEESFSTNGTVRNTKIS
uniref:Uncharacterized protein n=1 Tax=Steinernema glaseri TaxID=37863 RepID=A0A1I7YUF4_9BILA